MAVFIEYLHPLATIHHVGIIPLMLDSNNPKPARQQLHEAYAHGGGWRPIPGFTLANDNSLSYPDDPTFEPLVRMQLRNEMILVYEHAIVAIIQPDRSFEVARMD